MSLFTDLLARMRGLAHRESNADMNDEIRFHLEMETASLEQRGLSSAEARAEARRRFGGVDRYGEEMRDVRGARWLEWIVGDARYALRVARRFPAFTAIVVLTLGFAIGANAAIYSVVDAVLVRPMPFPHPEELAQLYAETPDHASPRFSVSYADVVDWQKQTRSFSDITAFGGTNLTFVANDSPERIAGLAVMPNFFRTFGVQAVIGRLFDPDRTDGADADAVVLGEGFFNRRFAGDRSIIGRPVQFGNRARVVLGVVSRDIDFGGPPTDVFVMMTPENAPGPQNHGQHALLAVGRMKARVTIAQANLDLKSVAARLAAQYQDIKGWSANAFLVSDELARGLKQPLLVLFAGAVLVLLISCINVANLLMTRGSARGREVALRQAIGASRSRLVSQMLVESVVLAILGGLLGVCLAAIGIRLLVQLVPAALIPQRSSIAVDARVFVFALGLSLVTAVIVGLWPALRTTTGRLSVALRDGGRTATGALQTARLRRALVVAEISLALVLLVCAGLVIQSLQRTLDVNPGFNPDHVIAMQLTIPGGMSDTAAMAFYRDLTSRIRGRGGIEAAAAANTLPMSGGGIVTGIRLIGNAVVDPNVETVSCAITAITPDYFKTIGIPLLTGRDVAWSDDRPTLAVSAEAARQFWPGESAIGKRIAFGRRDTVGLEVVGVVADARTRSLVTQPAPLVYMAYSGAVNVARSMTLVVRGRAMPAALIAASRSALREVNPTLPLYNARTLRSVIDQSVAQPRFNTVLLSLFAGMALLLAAIGIYGVISYSVTQRQQELGVRIALGAQTADVMRMVLGEGAMLAMLGVVVGLVGAFYATPLIGSWLFGIGTSDLRTFVAVAAALVGVALVASYLPARRATRVDPLIAMRGE